MSGSVGDGIGLGLLLSGQHPAGDSAVAAVRQHLEQVELARELGFSSVWTTQHFLSHPFMYFQSVPLLARVAAAAEGMTVGTFVLLTLLNPVEVAENAATLDAIAQASRTDGIYALATNLPGRLTAGRVLRLYKDQEVVERRHRDLKQTLRVRPIFLHNDDRIYALISTIGIALLIFGLIETELRKALHADQRHQDKRLPLLPEARLAPPTGANTLAAFQGLDLTYTHHGIELDPLTPTQQRILELLAIQPPWPQPER